MLARTLESSRDEPTSRRDDRAAAAGPEEAISDANDRTARRRPVRRLRIGRGGQRLSHEDGRRRSFGGDGDRAFGHRELGTGQKTGRGQTIDPWVLLIGDHKVETLEVKRAGAHVEQHGPVRG